MTSVWPASLDTLATGHVGGETIQAATVNDLADAANKLERSLQPSLVVSADEYVNSGSYADDGAAINAALTAAAASQGRGAVRLSVRTYDVATPIAPPSNTVLFGCGGGTVLKLRNASNTSVIKTANFDTLLGTNKPRGTPFFDNDPSVAGSGPSKFQLRSFAVDGNKANQTVAKPAVALYGWDFKIEDLVVKRSKGDGIYSEWGTRAGYPDTNSGDYDSMEASMVDVKSHHNDGRGVYWNGPHDSRIINLTCFTNVGAGYHQGPNGGGTHLTNGHMWGNPSSVIESVCRCLASQFEGSTGAQVTLLANDIQITGASRIQGTNATGEVGVQFGDGTHQVFRCLVDSDFESLETWVNWSNDGGGNVVRSRGSLGASTWETGTRNAGTMYDRVTNVAATDEFRHRQLRAGNGGTTFLDQNGRVLISQADGRGFLELAQQTPWPSAPASGRSSIFAALDGTRNRVSVVHGGGAVQHLSQMSWMPIFTGKGRLDASGATTVGLNEGGTNSASGAGGGANVFYLDPAEWSNEALFRLEAITVVNDVAPAATFTVGLYPITASGGAAANVTTTLGTIVSGTATAITTPAANTRTRVIGSEFGPPTAGFYALAVVLSAMAASSSAYVRGSLQMKS
jgi:hypothetical protein